VAVVQTPQDFYTSIPSRPVRGAPLNEEAVFYRYHAGKNRWNAVFWSVQRSGAREDCGRWRGGHRDGDEDIIPPFAYSAR